MSVVDVFMLNSRLMTQHSGVEKKNLEAEIGMRSSTFFHWHPLTTEMFITTLVRVHRPMSGP